MVIGITMLKVVPGKEKVCYDALRHAIGIKEIYHLFGEFDFFLILEALDKKELVLLLDDIRDRNYVLDAWSLLVSENESPPNIGQSFSQGRVPAVS
ncbi:MAG: Lrp/AsnC family transcriptional regulator [Methanotrichaceae archaeon]